MKWGDAYFCQLLKTKTVGAQKVAMCQLKRSCKQCKQCRKKNKQEFYERETHSRMIRFEKDQVRSNSSRQFSLKYMFFNYCAISLYVHALLKCINYIMFHKCRLILVIPFEVENAVHTGINLDIWVDFYPHKDKSFRKRALQKNVYSGEH